MPDSRWAAGCPLDGGVGASWRAGSGGWIFRFTTAVCATAITPRQNRPGLSRRGGARRDPPHRVADVVRDDQRAVPIDRHAHRAPAGLSILDETGDEIHRLTNGAAVLESDERDLVAIQLRPVPAAVLADAGAA